VSTYSLVAIVNQETYEGTSLESILETNNITANAVALLEIKEGSIAANSIVWTEYVNLLVFCRNYIK
jgi:hypothetical protein